MQQLNSMSVAWARVRDGGSTGLESLHQLAIHRHHLEVVSLEQANAVRKHLTQSYSEYWPPALLLLACWVDHLRLPALPEEIRALQTTVDTCLKQISNPATVSNVGFGAAAIHFMGSALTGFSLVDSRTAERCAEAVCYLLDLHRSHFLQGSWLPDVAAGLTHFLSSCQVTDSTAVWLLAALMTCWQGVDADNTVSAAENSERLMPLWHMMQQAAGQLMERRSAGPIDDSLRNELSSTMPVQRVMPLRLEALTQLLKDVVYIEEPSLQLAAALTTMAGLVASQNSFVTSLSTASPGSRISELNTWLSAVCDATLADPSDDPQPRHPAHYTKQRGALLAVVTHNAVAQLALIGHAGNRHDDAKLHPSQLLCLTESLLSIATDLSELCIAAASGSSPAAAIAGLQKRSQCALLKSLGRLGAAVAEEYPKAAISVRAAVRRQVMKHSSSMSLDYSAYLLGTPAQWLQSAQQQPHHEALVVAFSVVVDLLAVVWLTDCQTKADASRVGVLILVVFSQMHFCRCPHPSYLRLLQDALAAVAASSEGCNSLAAAFPTYDRLASVPAGTGKAAWLCDHVVGQQLHFLFNVMAPCCAQLAEGQLRSLMRVTVLAVQHPSEDVNTGSHTLFVALLIALPVQSRPQWAAAYLARAIPACPAAITVAHLTTAVDTISKALPVGDPLSVWCAEHLACRSATLLAAHATQSHGLQLSALVAHLLLVTDVNVLPATCVAAERTALDAPPHMRRRVCATIFATLSSSDDYVRKPMLMRWYHALLATIEAATPGLLDSLL